MAWERGEYRPKEPKGARQEKEPVYQMAHGLRRIEFSGTVYYLLREGEMIIKEL